VAEDAVVTITIEKNGKTEKLTLAV
jgi:hypothetical protein